MTSPDSSKDEILRSCYLFAEAEASSLDPLVAASSFQSYQHKTEIFAAQDEADGLRIVLSGQVRVWLADRDGREFTLRFMQPGDTFGEIAMLDGLPRTATASAVENTTCLFLPSEAMVQAMETDIALARCLIHSLCELMRRNLGTISSFAFVGLYERLVHLLHELAHDHATFQDGGAVFARKFSQTELALLLGVSREAVNKRFKVMVNDGLVQVKRGYITIPNTAALLKTADQK